MLNHRQHLSIPFYLYVLFIFSGYISDNVSYGEDQMRTDEQRNALRLTIEQLVSKNKPPIIDDNFNILLSQDFDHEEQVRVWKNYNTIWRINLDKCWHVLKDHIGDERYSITVTYTNRDPFNLTVGELAASVFASQRNAAAQIEVQKAGFEFRELQGIILRASLLIDTF